ncbi:MAG: hypothetical protein WC657_05935 [Candidatus Paceibacterota bacterium]|jgi:hypothetical protein
MPQSKPIGSVPLDWLKIPVDSKPWEVFETQDVFTTNFISLPNDYIATLGSGIDLSNFSAYTSLATTPSYQLPTQSQYYVAGRDVLRWGGKNDPFQVDFDRYVFTPDFSKNIAMVSIAPKSEPHHLSEMPKYLDVVPERLREILEAILKGELP